jgi:large subunit ribosomal protein L7/L12
MDNIKEIIEKIEKLTVVELNELVKALEERFNISAMPSVFMPQATGISQSQETTTQVASNVNVVLVDSGSNKIQIIKILKEINPNLGLKEAKEIADNPPQTIKENVPIEEAKKIKEKIENAGGKVDLK